LAFFASQDRDLDTITLNGAPCGIEGKPGGSSAQRNLNRHKNRWQLPADADMDQLVSLPAMLAPGNDTERFNEEKAATIRGCVVNVQVGGTESCNCETPNEDEKDTHIELGLAATVPEIQRVIVEVTPRLRMLMADKNVDWKTQALKSQIQGKWVEVTGWLTFDTAHIKQAENTHPHDPANWRATCWEIHPATSITVLDGPPEELANFRPSSFAALQSAHAAHVTRTSKGRTAVARLHEERLSKFNQGELDEAEAENRARQP
jgi:hypothetical protein